MKKGQYNAMYKGKYHLSDEECSTIDKILKREQWITGVSRDIEFFLDIFTPVILLETDLDINIFVEQMSAADIIFADFEYCTAKISNKNIKSDLIRPQPICLFWIFYQNQGFIFLDRLARLQMNLLDNFYPHKMAKNCLFR